MNGRAEGVSSRLKGDAETTRGKGYAHLRYRQQWRLKHTVYTRSSLHNNRSVSHSQCFIT